MELLRRKTSKGMIAGVAAGIAERLEVGPGLVRVAFVVSSFFGGIGFVLYGAAWLLLPSDRSDESIAEGWLSGNTERNSWGGAVLIGLAALIVVSSIDAVDGTFAVAAGLGVIGVLMYRGNFDQQDPSSDSVSSDGDRGTDEDTGDTAAGPAAPGLAGERAAAAPPPATSTEMVDPSSPGHVSPAQAAAGHSAPVDATSARAPMPPPPARADDPLTAPAVVAAPASAPRRRRDRERSRLGAATLGAMLLVLGAVAVADTTFGASPSLAEYLAAALAVVGLGLLVGSFWGRSRWLIVLGLILVILLQLASWFRVPITGGVGDPRFRPTTLAELRPEYRLGAGDMVVDLSDIAGLAEVGEPVSVEISLAVGSLEVVLPDDVAVNLDVSAVAGDVTTPAGNEAGPDIRVISRELTTDTAAGLHVDIDLGFGELIVVER